MGEGVWEPCVEPRVYGWENRTLLSIKAQLCTHVESANVLIP